MKKLLEELKAQMEKDVYDDYIAVTGILGLNPNGTLILNKEVDYDEYNRYLQNCKRTHSCRGGANNFTIFRSMWDYTVLFTKYDHPRIMIVLDPGLEHNEYRIAHIKSKIFEETVLDDQKIE